MSHRVTTKTEVKDKELAIKALNYAKMSYRETSSNRIEITSGKLKGAVIDLNTGEIIGDTDYHSEDTLGVLRQHYAVVKYKEECANKGISIQSEETDEEGNVVLRCFIG